MKVILRQDVGDLGKRGDILDVADGYARNYLVPKGFAMKATAGAAAQGEAMRRARDLRDAQDRSAAEEVATALVSKVPVTRADVEGPFTKAVEDLIRHPQRPRALSR
jgi:large subunit ribosomal protein L9